MADQPCYVLELFIADDAPMAQAIAGSVMRELDRQVPGRYEFTFTNVLDHPERAVAARVFATPMLIRFEPAPSLRVLGDLSDPPRVLALLGIEGAA
jgi:circadian clock protein KaiB